MEMSRKRNPPATHTGIMRKGKGYRGSTKINAAAAVVASIQHIQLNSNGGPVPVAKSGTVADLSEHRSLHLVHRPTTFGVRSQHLV
ncbi:hypothetical protein KIN20_029526 [Parelaphostrongylus tenuis]|uniref:Uncharacterized protein n=1 Tax=Parelaphostrongylus tenuis TaxID=148309 RepID=A0AAD5R2J5_PARTN|nr:hypothetical protein KIN20_029526 [Parelaphostrongylus tenuis]